MTITRRHAILSGAAASAATILSRPVLAQEYPARPIRMIVAFSAGSGLDVTTRIFAHFMSEELKQSVVVENRDGANGIIGTVAAAKAAPDGYTLMFVSPPFSNSHLMVPEVTYDPIKDFRPIVRVTTNPILLVAGNDQPYKTFKEFIQYARNNPGRVQYATSGKGSAAHLETALICQRYQVEALDIPYKSFAQGITDTIAGRVNCYLSALPALLPHVQKGAVRALVVGTATRSKFLPEVPTLAEEFGQPGHEAGVWYGLVAPAGTPDAVVKTLADKMKAVLANPALREKAEGAGNQISPMDTAAFTDFVRQERDKWEKVIESLGLKQLKA